jgi:hypothetical protein
VAEVTGNRSAGQHTNAVVRAIAWAAGNPEHAPVERRIYRMVCFGSVVFSFALVVPVNLVFDATGLANIPVTLFGVAMGLLFWKARQGTYYPSLVMASVVAFLDAAWFLSGGSQGSPPVIIPLVCIFIAVYPLHRSRLRGAALVLLNCVVLFVVDYHFPSLRVPYPSEVDRFFDVALSTTVTATACGLMVLAVLHSHQREQRRLEAANVQLENSLAEIRTLRGMLPVCSWCHKVRDDQGLWTQVELYLAQHTDTRLTHGICPECEQRYFAGELPLTTPDGQ